ncbi:unnamed protein product [Timema podura]|uniref:Peptidase S1 domain-containing protein n=1 Tax=Timema podura TaxID=61482 RepID=A0ABN7NMJ2_TIMPD|nr:unnamed protein product [Timema podura]
MTSMTTACEQTSHRTNKSNGEGSNQFKKCGFVDVQPTPLITKGQKTSRGQWPWHTALYQSKGIDLSYICGGSLISSKAVITGLRSVQPEWGVEARHILDQSVKAAHCVTRLVADQPVDPDTLVVYLGKYHLKLWSEGGVQDKQEIASYFSNDKNWLTFQPRSETRFDSFTVTTAISIQNKKRIHVHLTRKLMEELAYIRVYEYGNSIKKPYRSGEFLLAFKFAQDKQMKKAYFISNWFVSHKEEAKTCNIRKVSKVHVHPSYNSSDFRADLAILMLSSPVEFTMYVRPVCLWSPSFTELKVVEGKDGTVIGWGYDEFGQVTEELMMATMPIVSQQTCLWSYPQFFSHFTSNKTYCAGFREDNAHEYINSVYDPLVAEK